MDRQEFLTHTMQVLQSNPTSANLDDLVSAYAIIGNIAEDAEHDAELAEQKRKYQEAVAYGDVRKAAAETGDKLTDAAVNARVVILTDPWKNDEIEAKVKAKKIAALLDAVKEAIYAIKFLGRYDSAPTPTISLPPKR